MMSCLFFKQPYGLSSGRGLTLMKHTLTTTDVGGAGANPNSHLAWVGDAPDTSPSQGHRVGGNPWTQDLWLL